MRKRAYKRVSPTARTSQNLGDLLPLFLQKLSSKKREEKEEVFKAWFAIMGEELSGYTRPFSYEKRVLLVKVQSSTLYSLLCTREKPRLLQEMQAKIAAVKDIQFRFG